MSTRPHPHDHPALSWRGAVSLERTPEWTRPWRLPHADAALYAPGLMERAGCASGVRLAFRTDSTAVALHLVPPREGEETDPATVDLVLDGGEAETALVEDGQVNFSGLPAQVKDVELWLPNKLYPFRLRAVGLDDAAELAPAEEPRRPRWITHGSSITMCRQADAPTLTWPARVARAAGLNLTNMGFGGECQLDPLVAVTMRDLPADYLSLCLGINIYGGSHLSPRTFGPNAAAFVRILREKHPQAPLVVVSPIFHRPAETKENATGLTLEKMRAELERVVQVLREHGDANLHYVNGLELIGEEDEGHMPDLLHPDTGGMGVIAGRYRSKVVEPYFSVRENLASPAGCA